MSQLSIDRIPKKELENRYGIKVTALRDRLNALDILPEYDGRKAYIRGEDVARLDKLAVHLEDGGLLDEFIEKGLEGSADKISELTINTNQLRNENRVTKLKKAIADAPDPFIDLILLQKIAEMGWLLDTQRLAVILGISRDSLRKKKIYSHCGFVCIKAGKQRGNSVWSVKMLGEKVFD